MKGKLIKNRHDQWFVTYYESYGDEQHGHAMQKYCEIPVSPNDAYDLELSLSYGIPRPDVEFEVLGGVAHIKKDVEECKAAQAFHYGIHARQNFNTAIKHLTTMFSAYIEKKEIEQETLLEITNFLHKENNPE